MRIDAQRPLSASQARRPERRNSTGGFSSLVSVDEEVTARPTGAIAMTAPIANLIDLQNVEERHGDRQRRDGKLAAGHQMLDVLTQVQQALAIGGASVTLLQNMAARVASQAADRHDPQLDEILNEIYLRLAVETAKLEMAHAR